MHEGEKEDRGRREGGERGKGEVRERGGEGRKKEVRCVKIRHHAGVRKKELERGM